MTTRGPVSALINGEEHTIQVASDRLLIEVLRDDLELTGTKEGCSIGTCGLCSVMLDGRLVSACLVPAVLIDGTTIVTIEGIAGPDGTLSLLQEAFIRHGGFQCGICTPGQIVAATALLSERSQPTDDEIKSWMTGNLCRCTGYEGILNAVRAVSRSTETRTSPG